MLHTSHAKMTINQESLIKSQVMTTQNAHAREIPIIFSLFSITPVHKTLGISATELLLTIHALIPVYSSILLHKALQTG